MDEEDDIDDTIDILNQDAIRPEILNKQVPIRFLQNLDRPTRVNGVNYYEFVEHNFSLKDFIPTFEGFAQVPGGTGDLRGMFNDLNNIMLSEQKRRVPQVTLTATTKTNCNNKGWRNERSKLHNRYDNMCFYCGRVCKTRLQCDHVIPIMQMYVSLERTKDLFYNFERVHAKCNGDASNMTLGEMWENIGTSRFPGPGAMPFVKFNIKTANGELIQNYAIKEENRQSICRGYLARHLLSKLTFSNIPIQQTRALMMQSVVSKYLEFKTLAKSLLEEEGTVASILTDFATPSKKRRMGSPGSSGFGSRKIILDKIVKSDKSDKKWTAIFKVNGKKIETSFGARGMSDYTIHKDIERRNRYIARHMVDLRTKDPTRAGFLSMYVLWNYPSFDKSVKDYKKRLDIYNKTGNFPIDINKYNKNKFGVNVTKQLSRYKPVVLPDDILREIDKYVQSSGKIGQAAKQLIINKRMVGYLAQSFENENPGGFQMEFLLYYPQVRDFLYYLRYLSPAQIRNYMEELREIYIMALELQHMLPNDEDSLILIMQSKKYFTEISKKLGLNVNFSTFYRDLERESVRNFYLGANSFGKVPENVVDKKLYLTIKQKIKSGIKNRRWGAYDSGRLVQDYKKAGGKYRDTKKNVSPLDRWYKEKWVDACKWSKKVPCGRSDMKNSIAYCRPLVKVSKNTPKTVQKITKEQIAARCRFKKNYPTVIITGNLKKKLNLISLKI